MREPYEDWQAPRPKPLTIKLVRTQTQASIVIVQTDTPGADDQQQPGLECWSSTNASAARPPIGCLRTAPCRPQREPRLWRSFAPAWRVKGGVDPTPGEPERAPSAHRARRLSAELPSAPPSAPTTLNEKLNPYSTS
jgi:hypothetical protein